jgi:hypothetical protein
MSAQPEIQMQENSLPEIPIPGSVTNTVSVKMTEVIGASFLGLICLILLVIYIRSQRRNRRLTIELAKRAPRLVLLDRPPHRKTTHG